MSVSGGGKFGHEFVAAGATTAYRNSGIFPKGSIQRVVGSIIVGGTASVASGGKFANGAANAAFSVLVTSGISRVTEGNRTVPNNPVDASKGPVLVDYDYPDLEFEITVSTDSEENLAVFRLPQNEKERIASQSGAGGVVVDYSGIDCVSCSQAIGGRSSFRTGGYTTTQLNDASSWVPLLAAPLGLALSASTASSAFSYYST